MGWACIAAVLACLGLAGVLVQILRPAGRRHLCPRCGAERRLLGDGAAKYCHQCGHKFG